MIFDRQNGERELFLEAQDNQIHWWMEGIPDTPTFCGSTQLVGTFPEILDGSGFLATSSEPHAFMFQAEVFSDCSPDLPAEIFQHSLSALAIIT